MPKSRLFFIYSNLTYFSGTNSFNDKRTCRKTISDSTEEVAIQSTLVQKIDASPHDCTLMELVLTFWNDYTGNRHLRNGSVGECFILLTLTAAGEPVVLVIMIKFFV